MVAIVVGGFGGRVIAQARRRGWTATAAAEPSVEFADWIGLAGSYLVWLVFGIGFVGPVLAADVDPTVLVYALLSLARRYPAGQVVASAESTAEAAVLICSSAAFTATSFALRLG